jgi:acyl carrier protein
MKKIVAHRKGTMISTDTIDDLRDVLVDTLGSQDRAATINASTQLLGSLPELDSLAVVELAQALEDHFGFVIDDSEFTGDTFETLGTLAEFVERKRAEQSPQGS